MTRLRWYAGQEGADEAVEPWLPVWQDLAVQMNETPLRYRQGRLDAVGHIPEQDPVVQRHRGEVGQCVGQPSVPVGIPKQHPVQYNGIARNNRLDLFDAFPPVNLTG